MCDLPLQHCSHLKRLLFLPSLAFFTFFVYFSFPFLPSSICIDHFYFPSVYALCLPLFAWRSSNSDVVTHFVALSTFSSYLLWFSFYLFCSLSVCFRIALLVFNLLLLLYLSDCWVIFLCRSLSFCWVHFFLSSTITHFGTIRITDYRYSFWHCPDYWLLILALCGLLGIQLPLIILLRTS